MIRKFFVLSAIAVLFGTMLTACEDGGEVDPFKTVTLRELTRTTVVSKDFKYKLVNPQIVVLNRNLGLVRDGDVLEFIGARGLEDKLAGHTGGYLELNVIKKFKPFVHLRVESFQTETDTVMTNQRGALNLPVLTTPEEYGISSYEDQDIDAIPYNRTDVLNRLRDKKMHISGKLVKETVEGKDTYYLVGNNAKLRLGETSDAVGLMIKMFEENNYLFEGGATMTDVESYNDRIKSKVAGTIMINYVMYGDRLVTG